MKRGGARPGLLPAPLYFALAALLSAAGYLAVANDAPFLRRQLLTWLHLRPPLAVRRDSFYMTRVAPIFEERCNGCHGAERQRARLRLDTLPALHAGGRHGAALAVGSARHSELYRRVTLPAGDTQLMPPSGHERLSDDELKVLRLWIDAGASGTALPSAFVAAPRAPRKVEMIAVDPHRVEDERAPLAFEVAKLQQQYPNLISYVSRSSADLRLNAALAGEAFGDVDMVRCSTLGLRIVWLDLSNTSVTDSSAPIIAHMASLGVLRLSGSHTGDSTLRAVADLRRLRSLSVGASQVSDAALQPLRERGVRIHGEATEAEVSSAKP